MTARDDVDGLVADWERELPDLDMESVRVFLPLRRALQAAERRRALVLSRYGLTGRSLDLLVALRRVGKPYERTPSELASALVLSAGGVSQRLEQLENRGLLTRHVSPNDRRVVLVRLSVRGVKAIDELIVEYMEHENGLLHALDERDQRALARLLAKLDLSIASAESPAG